MYIPDHFRIAEQEALHDLIRARPFATLVSQGASGLVATHLPTVLKAGDGSRTVIECHIARANGHWRDIGAAGSDVLVIFSGAEGYVTPAWYASKQEGGKVVPTWNYVAVHAYGRAAVMDDRAWLLRHVSELSDQMEAPRSEPWAVSDAPASFIEAHLRGIVGCRIEIDRLEGKLKMSQNRPAADMQGVIRGLAERGAGDDAEAGAIVKRLLEQKTKSP